MEPILKEVDPAEAQARASSEEPDEEEDEIMNNDIPFTKRMREATRAIHNVSDTLINAKLAIAMTDDRIWAEGLLIFYEVFKYLEESIDRLKKRVEYFGRFQKVLEGLDRKNAFEKDLAYYYGENWTRTCYKMRPEVAAYVQHLKTLEDREPLRLIAYIYHMYMGLLSGGQVLKKKRDIKTKVASTFLGFIVPSCVVSKFRSSSASRDGDAGSKLSQSKKLRKYGNLVTDFSSVEGRSISDVKKDIAFTMNDIAEDLSKDERLSLIDESMKVFESNNRVVATIQVSWFDAVRNVVAQPFVALIFMLLLAYVWYWTFL